MVHWDSMQHVSLAVLGGMSMILGTLQKTIELKEISHRVMLGTETWKELHMHLDEKTSQQLLIKSAHGFILVQCVFENNDIYLGNHYLWNGHESQNGAACSDTVSSPGQRRFWSIGRSNRPCQCVIHGQASCRCKSNQEKNGVYQ